MRFKLMGAAAIAVLLACVAGAPAGDSKRYKTTVDLKGAHSVSFGNRAARGTLQGYHFFGPVESPKAKCAKARKVALFKRDSGPDTRMGKDVVDSRGYFTVFVPGTPPNGNYYVKTGKRKLKNGDLCKAAESENFQFQPLRAAHRAADVETKLRITGSDTNIGPESPAEYELNGKIKTSPKSDEAKKCLRRRTVTIYFRAPAFPVEEGQTKTNRRGKWFFAGTRESSLANGDYFATTPRAERGGQTCSRDTSPDHTIDYDSF